MTKRLQALFITTCVAAVIARGGETRPAKSFNRLAALNGTWQGTVEWNTRPGKNPIRATYQTISNGSAVMENLIMGDTAVPSMTTIYHMDGADLRMTHYCAAHNQPRLKAVMPAQPGSIHFAFVDGTDLAEHPAHVGEFDIRFIDPNHLVLEFTFVNGAKKSVEHIELART
ncbi:MAG TPA: hypothetical protein VII75_01805 [Thermoanaerobaculia bacterium]